MIINRRNLDTLYTSYNAAYRSGLTERMERSVFARVAMEVPSGTQDQVYAWMGELPGMREWQGERVVHGLKQHGFTIENRDFELTISVPANNIKDDTYGVFSQRFTAMGHAAIAHRDDLVFEMLSNASETVCYDGQYLVDTDHPVLNADGEIELVGNYGGGTGASWFLMEESMIYKPIIFQNRESADDVVRRDHPGDDNVFDRNEYEYGIHCRDNAGPGWWQTIYGSKQDLNAANYEAARIAMMQFTGDYGRPLGIVPNLLIVPPSLDGAAKMIVKAERDAAGATNVWMGTAEILVTAWLK